MKRLLFLILLLMSGLAAPTGAGAEELIILSSARITPPAVVERFERRHGIRLRFDYFESSEALAAHLEARPRGDLALLREHYVAHLRRNRQIAAFDQALLPNLRHLDDRALNSQVDPGRAYSVPYLYGTLGLLYHQRLFNEEKPTWAWLFSRQAGAVPFAITDQYRDALGAALIYLGFSYNSSSAIAIGQAAELLRSLSTHPAFMGFMSSETILRYFREDFILAAVTYNNLAARLIEENPDLAYSVPADGEVAWSYVYVVNQKSRNRAEVYKWLNYLLEPEVAAEVSAWNRAATPNRAALTRLSPEIRNNPIIFPPPEVWQKAQTPLGLDEESEKLYREYWPRLNLQ